MFIELKTELEILTSLGAQLIPLAPINGLLEELAQTLAINIASLRDFPDRLLGSIYELAHIFSLRHGIPGRSQRLYGIRATDRRS